MRRILVEHARRRLRVGQGAEAGVSCHYFGPRSRSRIKHRHRGHAHAKDQLAPQHFLYFFPLPQGQGSLRPTLGGAT
jgi:hypothetical protein